VSTAFSKVVSAVMTSLLSQPRICKGIYRARTLAVADQDDEAITVQWEQAMPAAATIAGAPIDWTTRVTVECFARSARPGDTGDAAVDPLLERVYERLASDSTLGGMVDDFVIAGIEAENTTEGKKTGWIRLTYIAVHRTDNLLLS
jgi:hypothetical protein